MDQTYAGKYFTLRLEIMDGTELIFKNLTEADEKNMRQKIWIEGVRQKTNHNCWRLIKPWIIEKAHIILQEGFITG